MGENSASSYRFKPETPAYYTFNAPPEAPVFEPTEEEFDNPLQYIDSIKETGEKYGIIKIRPPPEWQPPFAIDIETFKFKSRIQQLNQLEARTRIKLNFLGKLRKFWELQGFKLRLPVINNQRLDLYLLYHLVKKEGGYDTCALDMKWVKIATKMNFSPLVAHIIAERYKELLYHFAIFEETNLKKGKVESKEKGKEKLSTSPQKQPAGNVNVTVKEPTSQPLPQDPSMLIKSGIMPVPCNSSSQQLEKVSHIVTSKAMAPREKDVLMSTSPLDHSVLKDLEKIPRTVTSKPTVMKGKDDPMCTSSRVHSVPKELDKGSQTVTSIPTVMKGKDDAMCTSPHDPSVPKPQKTFVRIRPQQGVWRGISLLYSPTTPRTTDVGFRRISLLRSPMTPGRFVFLYGTPGPLPGTTTVRWPPHLKSIASSSQTPCSSTGITTSPKPDLKMIASSSQMPCSSSGITTSPKANFKMTASSSQMPRLSTGISPTPKPYLKTTASSSQTPCSSAGILTSPKACLKATASSSQTPCSTTGIVTSPKPCLNTSASSSQMPSSNAEIPSNPKPHLKMTAMSSQMPHSSTGIPLNLKPCLKRITSPSQENESKKMKLAEGFDSDASSINVEQDPLAKYVCKYCNQGDDEECMLLCDGCDDSYHTFCLKPPLLEVPKGDWKCPVCVKQDFKKPNEVFGFVTSETECSLVEFGEKADRFKMRHFAKLSKCFNNKTFSEQSIPEDIVEKEYWRILSDSFSKVVVEYGADLHSLDHGSGFPCERINRAYRDPETPKYLKSPWNLNNLPILKESLLSYITEEIPGMKVPWMYVGMCFSTFCWHIEDHWSYSINYLHWGDAKTWYGVPGCKATDFERVIRLAAPELFEEQPDLLHQLTTIINPNVLMEAGVPVFRTDQQAGEFVVTFPRAYHAGFNQGYNFAEAVNFAPIDWLPAGRECLKNYSLMKRYNVFSQDELLVNIARNKIQSIDNKMATAVYNDFVDMVNDEANGRHALYEWGLTLVEKYSFETLPDDARQCFFCKTTIYLGAVTCSCQVKNNKIACLRHFRELCGCPPRQHILRYRWNMIDLPKMGLALRSKALSQAT